MAQFGAQFVVTGLIEAMHGRALATAKQRREQLDYEVIAPATDDEAREAVESAAAFLNAVDDAFRGGAGKRR